MTYFLQKFFLPQTINDFLRRVALVSVFVSFFNGWFDTRQSDFLKYLCFQAVAISRVMQPLENSTVRW